MIKNAKSSYQCTSGKPTEHFANSFHTKVDSKL